MALLTLGLDLGVTSIGWALIREDGNHHELLKWGSRIFDPGMDDDSQGITRAAERRQKRALRLQYQRRRERKEQLIEALIAGNVLKREPTAAFFTEIDQRLLKTFPEAVRGRIAHMIPYLYRKMALDRPLPPEELARAIFHLAQRRGYQSNRRQEAKDEDAGVVKKGINELKAAIAESHARTLGEYFCSVDPEVERIRTRYTDRAMYQDEFRKICQAQRNLISPELEQQLYHAIFYQRPLKSCKHLIGRCRIYPELPRCSFAKEEAQLFRIYTTVSNLRIAQGETIRSLTDAERSAAVAFLNSYSPLFKKDGRIALSKLQKAVGLAKGEKFTLADDEKEIFGNELKNILFRAFGDRAGSLPNEEKEKFFNDLASIRKDEVLRKRLCDYWKLAPEVAEDVAGIAMPDEHCAFSVKALRELLPDLAAGVPLNTLLKLQHPFTAMRELDALPLVDDWDMELRNPVVHRVLTELRRVVNTIIARYGKPDRVRLELARDLKSTAKERDRIFRQNREREKERAKIAEKIVKEVGIQNPSRNDILKVLLAEECGYECPYSGQSFSMKELFSGLLEIEHIIPYSRSFDDSFGNKTLCLRKYNAQKNNRSPYEAFAGGSEYEQMLARVAHFKGPFAEHKLELFKLEKVDSEEFLSRNLNDTRYASKLAAQYLGLLYGGTVDKNGRQRIFVISGGCTALVRRAWGGNYLLGEGEKCRADHRHHAVDALTIAMTSPELVKWAAGLTPEQRKKWREKTSFVDNDLFAEAQAKIEEAAVSHHVVNKMRGELHNATLYGKDYGEGERHVRVALDQLKPEDLPEIVDPAIRKIILDKLGVGSVEEVDSKKLGMFKDPGNLPIMKDRQGNRVNTLKKVRIRQNKKTRSIGRGDGRREVANGANYVLAVFAVPDAHGNETAWTGEIVSLQDAVLRKQKGLPIFEKNRPGMKFKFSLQKGDLVQWEVGGRERLCVIRGVSLPQFYCVAVTDARMKKEIKAAKQWYQPTLSGAFKGKMKKYEMNLFGELRRAND